MHEKEIIRLDAQLLSVIGHATFHAKLSNGHEIIAFPGRTAPPIKRADDYVGKTVSVEMSPYDMSKGCIIN